MDKPKVLQSLVNRKKMFEEYLRQLKETVSKRADKKAPNK